MLAASGVVIALLTGCATEANRPTPRPMTGRPTISSPSATPTTAPMPPLTQIVLNPPAAEFGPAWSEVLFIPYGDAPEQLGTSLGGDGEGVQWGPSYGTQLPDGTWWFLDVGKLRLAHYSETGEYLGEMPMPEEYLTDGTLWQYARPFALSDGTLVLQNTAIDSPGWLLLSPAGTWSRTPSEQWSTAHTTDGTYLYGFDETRATVRIDPRTGATTPAAALATQGFSTFRITPEPERLRVDLGSGEFDLPLAASVQEGAQMHLGFEAVGGTDGVANVLLDGAVEDTPGDIKPMVGLLRVDAAGRGTVDDLPVLTSDADPADGLRLGVRWGDDRPWLMLIGANAVRVYRRAVD